MKKNILTLITASFLLKQASVIAQTWQQLPFSYPNVFQSTRKILASDNDVLVAGVNHSNGKPSYVSLDGGTNWTQIFPNKPIVTAEFGTDGNIYLVTTKKYLTTTLYNLDTLYRSSDGSNWTNMGKIPWGGNGHDDGDFMITGSNKLLFPYNVGSGNPRLCESTNNGANWTNTSYDGGWTVIAASYTGDTIILGTYNSGVRYSHDAGASFSTATGGNWGNATIGGAAVLPNGDVYVATGGQFCRSTDGGQTFTTLTPNPWIAQNVIEFVYGPNGKFYFFGVYGIFESTDCIAWTNISTGLGTSPNILDIAVSNNYIYAVVDTLLYKTDITATTSLRKSEKANLLSIYPNPAKQHLNISSSFSGAALLEVYDVRGTKIMSEIADLKTNSPFTISIATLPRGIYYIQLINEEGQSLRQKLLLE